MNVKVRLFASYADRIGRSELSLDLPEGSTAGHVVRSIASLPGAASLPASPLVAVNCEYARADHPLAHGDEVAIIPPVAGG